MSDYEKLVAERVAAVREQMENAAKASGRKLSEISLMAASKTQNAETVKFAGGLDIDLFGENRVQELEEKSMANAYCGKSVHLIGHLQSNKARAAVKYAGIIHSVDSVEIAKEIGRQAQKINKLQDVLIEVNTGGENSKFGINPNELEMILEEICKIPGVFVRGLMTIPPVSQKKGQNNRYFALLYKLFIDIKAKKYDNVSMSILSMGMSRDFCEAIAEGSNIVRIGTGIFGERKL